MYLREQPLYKNWEQLWKDSYCSDFFQSTYDKESASVDLSLSERQLFTQSNGRTLIGQDTKGRLHFISTPHESIYAIPSGGTDLGGQFKGNIGQYYQNDVALFLGKMRYEINLNSGITYSVYNKNSRTKYLDSYLPLTETIRPEFETRVFSLAPILEKEAVNSSSLPQLPGPAAVFYCMEIKNTSGAKLSGNIRLSFDQKFVNQFEKYGDKFEDYANLPYKSSFEQKLLMLWHPEACAAIQMLNSTLKGAPRCPIISSTLNLNPGESQLFTTIIAVAPEQKDINKSLGIIYQHTPLEWINVASQFWNERLGKMSLDIREKSPSSQKYWDMHLRFFLDNFNCLSFDHNGNLLTNSQGAPSHGLSRLWGIDIVPSVISVMYAIPEIGPKAIEYLIRRNTPRYSIYDDHSIFFYAAPLILTQKYLELTGDEKYFQNNKKVLSKLKTIGDNLLKFKNSKKALFSSHYASDLMVFRKYDYGANVQCYYALKGYHSILKILSQNTCQVDKILHAMPKDMAENIENEGPFGRQITGGTNLDEKDRDKFYISDKTYYYAGEDTATVLAPLYGLYNFNYKPYVNLHRYARSMFIACYDPEFQTMRELPFGMHPSATGLTLRLGGSYTRKEMYDNLQLLYSRLDESGSLFWWPRGFNKKRCLTRCSQGQGQWVQQSMEQWLGLRMDAVHHTLTIKPQGLINAYNWKNGKIGNFYFDISFEEKLGKTNFKIKNKNKEPFKIIIGARSYGVGTEINPKAKETILSPDESLDEAIATDQFTPHEINIAKQECLQQKEHLEFGPYGIVMPKLYSHNCSTFILRCVIAHDTETDWKDLDVEIKADKRWKIAPKKFYIWDYQPIYSGSNAVIHIKLLPPLKHTVAGFYINLPEKYSGNSKSVMLSAHPFQEPFSQSERELKLYIKGNSQENFSPITITLKKSGKIVKSIKIPVIILGEEQYTEKFNLMVHGEK
ncbi:hypothetical protein PT285_10315 [Lactobacillus sp. ESL0791]|uniref:hypothetical protein n=1 Tax=Lactobacillus sp. ESL0791 TaxID=2983234 RepID=UPI0023F84C77|nr:hypothetical protein [Lactobacillus sp. ESL0791]MDF7639793.1 hypothetical protein [Lactobacillus sp. ESL0791]